MNFKNQLNRRQFVGMSAAAAGLIGSTPILGASTVRSLTTKKSQHSICCFTKPLQHLSYEAAAEKVAEFGFDGVEATIRKGGQVEPSRIEEDLPKYVAALKKNGLDCTVMTSDVNRVDQPETERVLRTAADLGIKRYRMAYYKYDLKKPVGPQLAEIQPQLAKLAELNRKLGIQAVYQNHSGEKYVGAPIWDVYWLVKDLDPNEISLAYDIRHATAEGGNSWPISFNLVQSHLGVVYIKDFQWIEGKVVNVPLGTGLVKDKFYALLAESKFRGPISLHMEYVDHRDPTLTQKSLQSIDQDMKVLQKLLKS